MQVNMYQISKVEQHPECDNWTIVYFDEFNVISSKLEDSSYRYNAGDWIFYCPVNAVLPEYMLKHGYWDHEKHKGILGGSKGNRVKPFKGSNGIIFPVTFRNFLCYENDNDFDDNIGIFCCGKCIMIIEESKIEDYQNEKYNFASDLSIEEYVP